MIIQHNLSTEAHTDASQLDVASASSNLMYFGSAGQKLMLSPCNAFEKRSAVQALMFVRDLDTSLLGQNANGLEQFECLRQCTDELVNAILHVRQLLKRRRFDEGKHFAPSFCSTCRLACCALSGG